MRKAALPRVVLETSASGLVIEIRPLVRTRRARWRLTLAAAVVLAAALAGGARLTRLWETGLRRGAFEEVPLAALVALSLSVGVSTPLALAGLAALAFAEERIEVDAEWIAIKTTAFETPTIRRIARRELTAWVETYRPLPPWWTWAFRRLAARAGGHLVPLAGAAMPAEKREVGSALARATGVPFLDPRGRAIDAAEAAKIPRVRATRTRELPRRRPNPPAIT